jgi:hypothetical protein
MLGGSSGRNWRDGHRQDARFDIMERQSLSGTGVPDLHVGHCSVPSSRRNPFYFLTGVLGFLFAVTALVYATMTFRAQRSGEAYTAAETDGGLMRVMRQHGGAILGGEIALLAAASVAAMARDSAKK